MVIVSTSGVQSLFLSFSIIWSYVFRKSQEDGEATPIDIADCVVGAPVKNFALLFCTRQRARRSAPFSIAYNFIDGGVRRKVVRGRVHMRHD